METFESMGLKVSLAKIKVIVIRSVIKITIYKLQLQVYQCEIYDLRAKAEFFVYGVVSESMVDVLE